MRNLPWHELLSKVIFPIVASAFSLAMIVFAFRTHVGGMETQSALTQQTATISADTLKAASAKLVEHDVRLVSVELTAKAHNDQLVRVSEQLDKARESLTRIVTRLEAATERLPQK